MSINFITYAITSLYLKPFRVSYKSKPERFSALNMTNPLQFIKAEELEKQYNSLNATKQNIQNLISENSNIRELKEIQKRIAEIREEIPYTFLKN